MPLTDTNPGALYEDASGKLWRLVSYCAEPTATLQEVEPLSTTGPMHIGGAVGCLNFKDMRLLRPGTEQKAPHHVWRDGRIHHKPR